MALEGRLIEIAQLPGALRDRMFELLDAHFLRVSRPGFERDLAEKRWTILIEDAPARRLVGFSTLMMLEGAVDGRAFRAIYSGDTIVDRAHWGDTELGRAWISVLTSLAREQPAVPTFWFLTSMGHRTYRVLPLFFREYLPRADASADPFEQRVLDQLAERKFGSAYDAATGVIHFDPPRECLRPQLSQLTGGQAENPMVRFFLARNPGHAQGDELACLAAVRDDNLTRFARRLLERTERQASGA